MAVLVTVAVRVRRITLIPASVAVTVAFAVTGLPTRFTIVAVVAAIVATRDFPVRLTIVAVEVTVAVRANNTTRRRRDHGGHGRVRRQRLVHAFSDGRGAGGVPGDRVPDLFMTTDAVDVAVAVTGASRPGW